MRISLLEEIEKYTPKMKKGHSYQYDVKKSQHSFDERVPLAQWRLLVLAGIVAVVLIVFVGRAVSIQAVNREKFLGLAEKNRIREFSILPGRGLIYDRNGEVIVRNKPKFSVELNTLDCRLKGCDEVISKVQKIIKLDDEDRVIKELKEGRINIILATGVEKENIIVLESGTQDMPGISIETAPARDYLFKDAFAHVTGYVGLGETLSPTIVGKSGVEDYYNSYLSGVPGNKVAQVDSAGSSYRLITYKDPLPGKDVRLSIDTDLQIKAYELLKEKVEKQGATTTAGAVVAQNPLDGSILAFVSYPSFDPNLLSSGITKEELARLNSDVRFPFFNRAMSAAYPPGSTFKLVTASAVLMENIADRYTSIFDNGFIQVGAFIFRNWNTSGHGDVDMLRALQVSNDTYFYTMGGGYGGVGGLGIEKLSKWAKLFGFGSKTGIDLKGEVEGYMPDGTARDWYLGDDYISAIGQGDILATPLQVNNMMTYFANGGRIYKPQIVKSVDGVGDIEPKVLTQNLVSSEYYDLIRKGVNLASSPGGTAYPLYDIPSRYGIEVAGKTGTSEFISANGENKTHAWFSVFAPYVENQTDQANLNPFTDKPITITVFVEGGGGGSDDAAPIARELLGVWFEKK